MSTPNAHRMLTQDELLAEARERFGDNPRDWAFRCPNCGDIANGHDFREALEANPRKHHDGSKVLASDLIGQECIGRTLGALKGPAKKWEGRGCDWAAYGLFRGPWQVTLSNGRSMWTFPLAEVPAPVGSPS